MAESVTTLPNQRELFDIPQDVAYLNCAYMSPLLKAVAAVGEQAVRRKQHPWEISPPDFFDLPDQGRELFARIIGASREDIAIVPAVSYGVAIAALNVELAAGQEILLLEDQFPSNVYSWMELAKSSGGRLITLPRTPGPLTAGQQESWTARIIDAISPQTALVALPHCHWIDGSLIDLVAVGEAARNSGASLVLDVTQSAGAMGCTGDQTGLSGGGCVQMVARSLFAGISVHCTAAAGWRAAGTQLDRPQRSGRFLTPG